MHRIDGDGNVAGQFTEGDPGAGQPATQVTDDWLNAVQEEIATVCLTNGALVKANNGQLLVATDARYARPAVTTATTWQGAQVVNSGGSTGEAIALKPGSSNFALAAFYARSASPTARSGYIGYGAAAATTLTVANELAGGGVAITPGTTGVVTVGRTGGTVALVGNTTVAGSLTVDNVVTGSSGGPALGLKPGASADHVYMELYARSAAPGTRSGYFGYATAAGTTMSVVNSLASGNIDISPGSGGKVQVTSHIGFAGSLNPAVGAPTTNTITPVSIAKAWVRGRTDGSGGVFIDEGHNITSLTIVAISTPFVGNVIRVTYASAFTTSVPCAVVSSCDATLNGNAYRIGTSTTTTVSIVITDGAGTTLRNPSTTGSAFSLAVFGPQ